ncbi:hypothetical protein [Thiothrix winogradskyi]|uniref:HPt domain-containing protein n=1 Tax=Thiothrix winogradskyi TaxID=96472 RepID=A0ABY3T030_9GAMM|nr:hypothetical protein [Thiothrix winogradskyi]UJS24539.1 hypothetical protein L2Y54_00490 [Thiothrix winogradskyi]
MSSGVLFSTLIEMLGKEAAHRFLTLALPELQRSQQMLMTNLQQQDWQAAAALAHKLIATAHLYDVAPLQDTLIHIKERNLAALQHPSFIPSLAQTFQQVQDNILLFISDNY